MLTTFEVVGFALVLIVLLPVAIISLATGSKPPKSTSVRKSYMALGIVTQLSPFRTDQERIVKCYHIEPYLRFVSDLLLVAVCTVIATQLALHFRVIDPNLGEQIKIWFGIAFFALVGIYFLILTRGLQRLRDAERG